MRSRVAPVLAAAGAATALLGLGVSAGWLFGLERVTTVLVGLDPMTFNSALTFACLGVALLAVALGRHRAAIVAALLVMAYGVVTLGQHLFSRLSFLDTLLLATPGTGAVVRGSPNSAIAFLLLGLSVLLLAGSHRFPSRLSTALLATSALVIALVDLLAYLLASGGNHGFLVPQMALHTTVGVLVAGGALLHAGWWSERGIGERPVTRVGYWVATVVFVASVFLAQLLRANERSQISATVQVAVQGVADQLDRMLHARMESARTLATTLARVPPEERADLAQVWPDEGARGIGILEPGRAPRWLVLRDDGPGWLRTSWPDSEARAAMDSSGVLLPTLVEEGDRLWLGLLAQAAGAKPPLAVWVMNDLEPSISAIFASVTGRFSVALRSDGHALLQRGVQSTKAERLWGEAAEVAFGRWRWEVSVWPNTGTLASARSALPALTLAAGALVGVLLGVSLALARHARERTLEFQRANDLLIGEVREREAAEEALRQREEELRQAQKLEAVGRLAGGIAHDYNNLLTVIRSNARSLVARESGASLTRDALEHIDRAAARGSLLTARLLAFSQRQLLQPETFSIGDLATGLHDELSHLLGPQVRLLVERVPGVDLVHLDRRWITQVILDLALNGREAMPFGGTLWLRTRVADDQLRERYGVTQVQGSVIMLEIVDSGRGMDEATRERLFEPFFSTKPFGQGSGLALASAYGIVRQSGGEIAVLSEPDRGTRVALFLPLVDGPAPDPAVPNLEGRTVLVAEDEPGILRFIRRTLEAAGCRVLAGESAEAALEALAASGAEPDLLVSDIVMPGLSGVELAERLRRERPELGVLFVSAYTSDALKQRGIASLAAYLLQKPFTAPELLEQVGRTLQAHPPRPAARPI